MIGRVLRFTAVVPALFLFGAAPAERVIPFPDANDTLVIPRDSPVRFQRFGKEDTAYFTGKFILTGKFRLECDFCEGSGTESDLELYIVPDPGLAARLPHWKKYNDDNRVFIKSKGKLVRSLGNTQERLEIAAGKRDDIHGRIAILVDDFRLSIECDSASLTARYVAIAKPPQLAMTKSVVEGGC
jgi:hypothetical protein